MSKNISNLSGRIGLKKNLFQKISDRSLNSTDDKGIKEIANEYIWVFQPSMVQKVFMNS